MVLGNRDQAGTLIREYRLVAGLTQRQLAEAAGLSIGVVRDLEQGRTAHPHAESVRRLTRALGLDERRAGELAGAGRAADVDTRPGRSAAVAGRGGRASVDPGNTGIRIRVLGPLTATRDGEPLPLGGGMRPAILGLLALHPGGGLHRETIIDGLWGTSPPATAANQVQAHVSALRNLLDPGRPPRDPAGLLVSHGTSYRLNLTAGQLDLLAFGDLTAKAAAAGPAAACALYEEALQLWPADPLSDVDRLRGHPALVALAGQRAATVIDYADAAFGAGWHDRPLPHLSSLTSREPLNETAHARLMIGLAASGQQAAALATYDGIRRRLAEQLGVSPSAELTAAHLRVLRQDIPSPERGAGTMPSPGRALPRPPEAAPARQLPGAVAHFAGRETEIGTLTSLMRDAATQGTVVITAIGGLAGIGKTALAVYWAHQISHDFPDGQLYVNLRGYDPSAAPVRPSQAIRDFLAALHVAAEKIPADPDAAAALYRTVLAGKRVLVLLDNARDEQQVRPLLPASPSSLVVVTSRSPLAGLVAANGAHPVTLDLLTTAGARDLLVRRLGQAKVDAEPQVAAELTELCGRLPLALAIAAARAAAHPTRPLAAIAAELRDRHGRLEALDAGEPVTSVRAVFSWSYLGLDAPAARMFRLLGLHPGQAVTASAAAAMADVTPRRARDLLRELARAGLLAEPVPGRFALHDLLRAYAREQANAQETEQARQRALAGLFAYYQAAASAAMDALFPADKSRRPPPPDPAPPIEPIPTAVAGREWLDAERAVLIALTTQAAASDSPEYAVRLGGTLYRYLDTGAYFAEVQKVYTCVLQAARKLGDRGAQADSLKNLGSIHARRGDFPIAETRLHAAQALYQDIGDRRGQAQTLDALGAVDWFTGRLPESAAQLRRALAIYREVGEQLGAGRTLNNLGQVLRWLGLYSEAASCHQQALRISRQLGNRRGQATALSNLGVLASREGRHSHAEDQIRAGLEIIRDVGNPISEADALNNLGHVLQDQAQYAEAAGYHRRALTIFREIGDRWNEAGALTSLGQALAGAGQPGPARESHQDALALARQIGARHTEARAHAGLARIYGPDGDDDEARQHRQQARALYAFLGVPDTER